MTAGLRIALPRLLSPAAFVGLDPRAPVATLDGATMGTRWRVRLTLERGLDADALGGAIVARLAGLVAEMSHWEERSVLCRFNRLAAGRWLALPPDFARVIAAALAIAEASGGRFDPTLGRVVDLRGFGPRPPAVPPAEAAVAAAQAHAGWRRLVYDPPARRLRQPGGLSLDLSGIAKGYAVDAVAALLRQAGVRHALVEVGGELAGFGLRPDGDPWWIDLETPPGLALPPLRVALHGLAVATSGDTRKGAHTLDPRTGRSLDRGVRSVSVVHADAMHADAWATALGVAGPDGFLALATRHDLAARLIAVEDGEAREWMSPALAAMLAD